MTLSGKSEAEVVTSDGKRVPWVGIHSGPLVLMPDDLAEICRQLVGLEIDEIGSAIADELKPHAATHDTESCILFSSASTVKGCFECDLAAVAQGRAADDFAAYNEVRAVYFARPSDLVVGCTEPWKAAAEVIGANAVPIPSLGYYYLSHALLKLASRHGSEPVPELVAIIDRLRQAPKSVIRIFALDPEFRIFLLWLKRSAGIPRLLVDANGPQVVDLWNHKSSLHPTVASALTLSENALRDPFDALAAESALNLFGTELGIQIPRLPGYTVLGKGVTGPEIREQVTLAVALLRERYGLKFGCSKPSTALTGSRIRIALPLDRPDVVDMLADQVRDDDEDYIIEANADYLRHPVMGHDFTLTPSVHIVAGSLGEGATMQITRGSVWQGNVYIDEHVCGRMGLSAERYDFIRSSMAELLRAFSTSDHDYGLVKGGIDFAVARVGGHFGNRILVGMQDLNLSSNGAEFLRAFLEEARGVLPGIDRHYAATKSVRPQSDVGLRRLMAFVDHDGKDRCARAITSCPGCWGLIAVCCNDPVEAAEEILRIEQDLARVGMIEAVQC